jgi:LDH2 family malate/lactate/ureidoglycolate dehydrogenase
MAQRADTLLLEDAWTMEREDKRDSGSVWVDPDDLKRFVSVVFQDLGLGRQDADISAEAMVRTDMRGQHTHGVFYLPKVVAGMRGGGVRLAAKTSVVRETPATAVLDGDGGIGFAVAVAGCDLAAQKAREVGSATVLVRNSNFFGAASFYTLRLAEQGLIGTIGANSTPGVAPPGALKPVIGTQPISYGVPDPDGQGPIILDIAISQAAGTKVRQALERGESIPEGWLLSPDGRPTTDPRDMDAGGMLLPVGGHKGYGIGIWVEIMAGVLAGAGVTHDVLDQSVVTTPSDTGHWITAMSIDAFSERSAFDARLAALRAEVHAVPTREGQPHPILPGEPEFAHERYCSEHGLELEKIIWDRVRQVAGEVGRSDDLEQTYRMPQR